jgi:TetR/AcrR family transcriptional regulator, transcriptional repressor for nem operon
MGRSQADKAETHQRIVDVAARRFRELGIDGISVADIMGEVGMTVGGFYRHFASRDDLVVEALEVTFRDVKEGPTLKETIEIYLSETHRNELHSACGLSALVNDVARSSDDAREAFMQQVERSRSFVEGQISPEIKSERSAKALVILSALIGAMSLSRAIVDPEVSSQVLDTVAGELVALFAASRPTAA